MHNFWFSHLCLYHHLLFRKKSLSFKINKKINKLHKSESKIAEKNIKSKHKMGFLNKLFSYEYITKEHLNGFDKYKVRRSILS